MRDKEEELENSLTKIDNLRQDIRKAEKLRRELELRSEEAVTEAAKEKKLREKFEASVRQLEKDLSALKAGGLSGAGSPDGTADVVRLKGELERLEVSAQEALLAQQAKYNMELSAVREQFEEAERRCRSSEMDMAGLREKLEKARLDSLQVRKTFLLQLLKTKDPFRALALVRIGQLSTVMKLLR